MAMEALTGWALTCGHRPEGHRRGHRQYGGRGPQTERAPRKEGPEGRVDTALGDTEGAVRGGGGY